jgi:hypothetical protein
VTESPAEALVPSPGNPPEGYPASGFLQNRDFGKINKNEYNIDLSLQVLDTSTIDAFVKARERWMTVITGDIEDVNVTEALLNVTGMTGVVPETHVMIDACGNPLPALIDDVHFCALETTIDGAGWVDAYNIIGNHYYNIMAIVYPEWLRDDGKVISGSIIFDTCDATNMMNLGLWDDFILKAMGTVLGTMPLAINTNKALVNGTNYVGGYGNDIWSSWGCSGNPPLAYDVYRVPANSTVNWTPEVYYGSPEVPPTKDWTAPIRTTVRSPVWGDCLKNELLSRGKKDSGGIDGERCGDVPCSWANDMNGGLGIDSPYQGSKLSKLSVALFHDLGYEVNYDGMYLL